MALPVLAPLLTALAPWITRFLMLKGALLVAGFLGRLGLVLATNEFAMQPLIDMIMAKWQVVPPSLQCWLSLFGVTKAASIMVSGLTLISAKRVFFAKS